MDNGAATGRSGAASGAPTSPAPGAPTRPAVGVPPATGGEPAGGPNSAAPTRGLIVVGPGAAFGGPLLRRFAAEGFALGVLSRSSDTVARVTAELAADGHEVTGAVTDVTDQAAFAAATQRLAAAIGGLTVLVYNAKLSIRGTAFSVRADSMNQTLAVNVTGALSAVQVAVPLLVDRPGATVLLTVAGARSEPAAGRFALVVGKAGLAAMGEAMAPGLAAQGVRLRTVVLDGRVGPVGPLLPDAVADHFWHAFAAPGGSAFRLAAPPRRRRGAPQLPLEV